MHIRCERCASVFALEDSLVPELGGGAGFPVECGRCHLVFQAKPAAPALPSHEAVTDPGGPGKQPRAELVDPTAPTPATGNPAGLPAPRTTPSSVPRATPPSVPRKPLHTPAELERLLKPRRPPGGQPEIRAPLDPLAAELPRRGAGRWMAAAIVLALAAAGGALLVPGVRRRVFAGLPREALALSARARERLLRDDDTSLAAAAAIYAEAAQLAPGEPRPVADRAFALLLAGGAHKDSAERREKAARSLGDQLAKLQVEQPPGWTERQAALVEQLSLLSSERDQHARESTRLLTEGGAAARLALEDDPQDASAQRAWAYSLALGDAPDRAERFIAGAERAAPGDAFTLYVKAAMARTGAPSPEKLERALAALAAVQAAEPRLVRALFDRATIALERQDLATARASLLQLLEQSPAHERGKELLAQLGK